MSRQDAPPRTVPSPRPPSGEGGGEDGLRAPWLRSLAEKAGPRLAPIGAGLAVLLFLAVLVRVLWVASQRPAMNFDMLDYMALALAVEVDDPVELHRRTYELAEAELPPEAYRSLTTGSRFRETMRGDVQRFTENLAIHRGRILYVLAVYATWKLGSPLSAATWRVSQLFFVLSVLAIFVWTRRHLPLGLAALASLALMLSPPVLALAPASMPDSMTLFPVLVGAYLLLERGAFRAAALALTLTMLVRPEILLFVCPLALALFLFVAPERRPSARFLLLWLAGTLALFATLRISTGETGWWPVFLISFINRGSGRLEGLPDFDPALYWQILGREAADLSYVGYFVVGPIANGSTYTLACALCALIGVVLAARARAARELSPHQAVLCALLAACATRYFLFPYLWDRYYVYFLVLVPLVLLAMGSIELRRLRSSASLAA